jgi:hypothetical protein
MNSDLYKFKSTVCIRFRKKPLRILMAIEVNVTKEIGKFYQNKKTMNTAIGYYEKSNAKSMDIDMERICFCFNRIRRQKSLKKQ